MRRPIQSTDLPLEPTPTSFLLFTTPSTSRSVRSLPTEASVGTPAGSTSVRLWATSSSGSNPSVPRCGTSTSDPLPWGGLTKNSASFSTPTVTREETHSVNHQLAPLCQPSGALFTSRALKTLGDRAAPFFDPIYLLGDVAGVVARPAARLHRPASIGPRRWLVPLFPEPLDHRREGGIVPHGVEER